LGGGGLRDATEDTKNPEIGGNKLQGRDREGGQGGARGGGWIFQNRFWYTFFFGSLPLRRFFLTRRARRSRNKQKKEKILLLLGGHCVRRGGATRSGDRASLTHHYAFQTGIHNDMIFFLFVPRKSGSCTEDTVSNTSLCIPNGTQRDAAT
jgi:hypothetical protein